MPVEEPPKSESRSGEKNGATFAAASSAPKDAKQIAKNRLARWRKQVTNIFSIFWRQDDRNRLQNYIIHAYVDRIIWIFQLFSNIISISLSTENIFVLGMQTRKGAKENTGPKPELVRRPSILDALKGLQQSGDQTISETSGADEVVERQQNPSGKRVKRVSLSLESNKELLIYPDA